MDINEVKADARAVNEAIDAVPGIMRDFCNVTGVSPTRLGYLSVGNPNLYRQLSTGKRYSQTDTIQRVLKWIVDWEPWMTRATGTPRDGRAKS